ncbi:hypothetical protein BDR06DRAFT_1015157 [Suillus hirtellus]|nr:hypothetical protein BDR06DRAFT_1015157 [Suillus hirtellus]
MSGVAYTGDAACGAVYICEVLLPLKDPQQHVLSPGRTSPSCHTPTGSSDGESVTAVDVDCVSYKQESYQSNESYLPQLPSPPLTVTADNARVTPPAVSKLSSNTPPLQAMKTRTPDKSLPVEEEPEDDVATPNKVDSYTHGNDSHEEDNDALMRQWRP